MFIAVVMAVSFMFGFEYFILRKQSLTLVFKLKYNIKKCGLFVMW